MDQGPAQYLQVSDLAAAFAVSHKTVIQWIRNGKVRAIQPGGPGGAYRIPASELDRLKSGEAA